MDTRKPLPKEAIMGPVTAKLNSGIVVLGKKVGERVYAKTFVNLAQAQQAATIVGGRIIQPRLGPVFYVAL